GANGTPPLTYQWRKGGTPIGGATNANLILTNISGASAGTYDVVVTNTSGSITSSSATLTIVVAPIVTLQPASQSAAAGANVTLQVSATGAGPLTYQWRKNGTPIG